LGCASPAWRNYFKNRNIGPNEIATDLFFQVLRAEAFGEQDVLDDVVDDELRHEPQQRRHVVVLQRKLKLQHLEPIL
jgi:hypothetical protein